MEIVGIASSFAGLASFASSLVIAGHAFYHPFKEYREEVETIVCDVEQLRGLLAELQLLVDGLRQESGVMPSFPESVIRLHEINACWDTLNEVKRLYEKSYPKEGKVVQNLSKRFLWPISRGDIQDIMARLERHKTTFSLALTAYGMYYFCFSFEADCKDKRNTAK